VNARSPPAIGLPAACLALGLAGLVPATAATAATPADSATSVPAIAPARIEARYDPAAFAIGAAGIDAWIARSAAIVTRYYGGFTAPLLRLRIVAVAGTGVRNGKAYPGPGSGIEINVGREVSGEALTADWVLVHEMIHLALPELDDSHTWLSEGLATYVEGMARVGAGNMTAEDLWLEYARKMPQGEPKAGDRGLDHTPTWARTYWGGALFCLNADVGILTATGNRAGLREALRAILKASGGMRVEWPIERVLAVGDAATGTDVLARLYAAERDQPRLTDLDSLWTRLGVRVVGEGVEFDDRAPLAALRVALTAPTPGETPALPLLTSAGAR
jgi:hypothetical protein